MESQIWFSTASSVALWCEGSEKGQWLLSAFLSGRKLSPSSCLDARHFSFSLYATGAFQAAIPRGSESVLSLCVSSLRGTAWAYRSFFHWLNPHWFLQPEFQGTFLPGTRALGWGSLCGSGTPCSRDIPPEFVSNTCGCGTSPFCISAPPPSLDGCGFFNSTVARLPFNSISDGSEWWFYILVVILMW